MTKAHLANHQLLSSSIAPRAKARRCPHCQGTSVARSRRRGIWRWLRVGSVGLHRYRCGDCWKRFYTLGRIA